MKAFAAFFFLLFAVAAANDFLTKPVLDEEIIKAVNSASDSLWVAGINERFVGKTIGEVKALLGARIDWDGKPKIDITAPSSFDARDKWPNCISPIRDQQQCGSCWAFSAAGVLTDRTCIKNGNLVVLSPEYILECDKKDYGCDGGYLNLVWEFLDTTGTVTDACDPYSSGGGYVGKCPTKCKNGGDLQMYKSKSSRHITGVQNIMDEIYNNGPVQVAFSVYQDFFSYKSGIYHHKSGSLVGGHAVRAIGWGVDTKTNQQYWIIANSWGTSWGMNGYFWILKGSNECGIESNVWAGLAA